MTPEGSSHKEQVAWIKSQIGSFEGLEAILEETNKVSHVRISQLIATPEYLEVVMTDMRTPGMEELHHSPYSVGIRWELLGIDGGHWTAQLPIRWQLTFDAEVVSMLKEMAAIVARRGSTVSTAMAHEVRCIRFEMRFPGIRAAIRRRPGTGLKK